MRTLLLWLVLLAVPFQGYAAAAMRCAHGAVPAAAQQSGHEAAKPPCHGDPAPASPDGHAAVQDPAPDDDPPHQNTCGNCAVCSVGAAMAPASRMAPPDCCPCTCCPPAAPARIAAADPDLPERPPRSALA